MKKSFQFDSVRLSRNFSVDFFEPFEQVITDEGGFRVDGDKTDRPYNFKYKVSLSYVMIFVNKFATLVCLTTYISASLR